MYVIMKEIFSTALIAVVLLRKVHIFRQLLRLWRFQSKQVMRKAIGA